MRRFAGKGVFITFEGGEGAGKSTQIRLLAESLRAQGHVVVTTREPGGSTAGERIRAVLLDPDCAQLDAASQALLFAAARRDHVLSLINPALKRGAIVLCDRFADSTRAYQGAGGQVSPALLTRLERLAVGRTQPDLTLIFDLDPLIGMARASARRGAPLAGSDSFERQAIDFHQKVRAAFLAIAAAEPHRCRVIDATPSPEKIAASVAEQVSHLLVGRR